MFNKLKKYIHNIIYAKHDVAFVEENNRLKQRINKLVDELGDPRHVVKRILGRDIKWFNYKELKRDEQKAYVQAADQALRNATLQNEIKHACADLVNEIAKTSKNFESVMELRMTLNGIQLLLDRLEELGVEPEPENKNPYSSV